MRGLDGTVIERDGKSAAILIVGNEILSGKIPDDNSAYLSRQLRALGVDVRKISVVPDEADLIAKEIASLREHNLIFTAGGVGPTHDDVTIEGIARGLGRKVVRHTALQRLLQTLYPDEINEARLKLTEVPEGAELIYSEGLRFPLIRCENVYIFPGIPDLLRKKFEAIADRFRERPFFIKKIYLSGHEEEFASHLWTIVRSFPRLLLGSYPAVDRADYKVLLTLESKDPSYLEGALAALLSLLPKETVLKIE